MWRFILILVLLGAAGFWAWEFIPVDVPFERELTKSSGDKISVKVIGKNEEFLTAIDQSNNQRAHLLIHQLSLKDRLFMYRVREQRPPSVEYPFSRELTDVQGRTISAEVIGKSLNSVTVILKENNQRFEIPFSKLSPEDREVLKAGKNHAPPQLVAKPPPKLDVPYINRREAEIVELEKKQEILEIQITSGTLNEIVRKNQSDQLESIKREIRILQTAIETYKWRNKIDDPNKK